jgi:hypothetical protein
VADASALPTSPGVNPMVTTSALAHLIAAQARGVQEHNAGRCDQLHVSMTAIRPWQLLASCPPRPMSTHGHHLRGGTATATPAWAGQGVRTGPCGPFPTHRHGWPVCMGDDMLRKVPAIQLCQPACAPLASNCIGGETQHTKAL